MKLLYSPSMLLSTFLDIMPNVVIKMKNIMLATIQATAPRFITNIGSKVL